MAEERFNIETPYGPVLKKIDLPNKTPGRPDIPLYYVDPCAVWTLLVAEVPWLWELLVELAASCRNAFSCLLFQDGATAGNLLHFAPAKAMEMWYMSLAEFGDIRLGHSDFWISLCAMRTQTVKEVAGGISHVASVLVQEIKKMSDGLMVQAPGGDSLYVWCRMGGFMLDESAQQGVFSFKGAAYIQFAVRNETVGCLHVCPLQCSCLSHAIRHWLLCLRSPCVSVSSYFHSNDHGYSFNLNVNAYFNLEKPVI